MRMKRRMPCTKGRKKQNISCPSNNKKNDKQVQKEVIRATLGHQQNLDKMKNTKNPTIIVCYYRTNKKIHQNQLESEQETPESSDDPSSGLSVAEARDLGLST
ncbi:uncharacterized protein LOC100683655 isoform X1 [Canis lupus familiaris]|uniref:uncharacterized protein LOC100683655 isoform X1 n=1 Tax=Canis lupus familiaris TaxID=9615 RepID=UPI0002257465|nr:uncharacterized protein LOC100683655 isoform X1 [Canis lupus familiaris]XP_038299043.1 uncharacterized protein LOC100683655 isoform X1 [Canis lupus familiaris]XP_048960530.1 uncharacterized protein LOC112661738 isoform X1 [Canis lupus dingo]|eukprot:XP_003434017.1 uncharacterized protein LOC100683655 isoform X1 [Canis lupus familiaris]